MYDVFTLLSFYCLWPTHTHKNGTFAEIIVYTIVSSFKDNSTPLGIQRECFSTKRKSNLRITMKFQDMIPEFFSTSML